MYKKVIFLYINKGLEIFKVNNLPPAIDCETIEILKALIKASRSLAQLKGEIKKIPNSQILIDTLSLQEAKDSNEIENIVTTDDELFQSVVDNKIPTGAAKEAQNYANALKKGFEIIHTTGLLTTNDIKKIQHIVTPNHPIRKLPGTHLKNPKTGETVYTPPQHKEEISKLMDKNAYYSLPV